MKSVRLLVFLALPAVVCPQEATPIFSATSELVLIDVQVVHKTMRTAAPRLRKEDFQVFEDGATQEISSFSHDELPLSIVLLLDINDSVRPVMKRLAHAARAALDRLKPDDQVAVMTASETARLVDGFTVDRNRSAIAIERAAASRPQNYRNYRALYNDDIYAVAEQAAKSPGSASRRVVIWLTDNLPRLRRPSWEHSEADAIRRLHETGVVVTPLLLTNPGRAAAYNFEAGIVDPSGRIRKSIGNVYRYAEVSGGEVFPVRGNDVESRLAELIDSLRSRYTIGYRPAEQKPSGTFCRLLVALAPTAPLRSDEWSVLAREGYYRLASATN